MIGGSCTTYILIHWVKRDVNPHLNRTCCLLPRRAIDSWQQQRHPWASWTALHPNADTQHCNHLGTQPRRWYGYTPPPTMPCRILLRMYTSWFVNKYLNCWILILINKYSSWVVWKFSQNQFSIDRLVYWCISLHFTISHFILWFSQVLNRVLWLYPMKTKQISSICMHDLWSVNKEYILHTNTNLD